ncbi:hypothetical protein ACTS9D_02390 [Empedobacter brevis]
MIRKSHRSAKAMEFTHFRKKETVTDDALLFAALAFETAITAQSGLIFHCLVRNYDNEYANVLFGESLQDLKNLANTFGHLPEVTRFFELIDPQSVHIEYHEIQQDNFKVPEGFSCIEKGTFTLVKEEDADSLLHISENIEKEYLNKFHNTKAHFTGRVGDKLFSEITIGQTLAQTKQICMGYFDNPFCMELLNKADKETMNLDFWYVMA